MFLLRHEHSSTYMYSANKSLLKVKSQGSAGIKVTSFRTSKFTHYRISAHCVDAGSHVKNTIILHS